MSDQAEIKIELICSFGINEEFLFAKHCTRPPGDIIANDTDKAPFSLQLGERQKTVSTKVQIQGNKIGFNRGKCYRENKVKHAIIIMSWWHRKASPGRWHLG